MKQHRVIHKPQEKSIDVGIVVPSFKEGKGILDTLYSAAVQKYSSQTKVCVFIVINNSQDRSEADYQSNKETAELVVNIIRKNIDTSLPQYIQKKIRRIIKEDLHISLVDVYTEK